MYSIKQPNKIIFGKNSAKEYQYPKHCLIITSKGAKKRGWYEYLDIKNSYVFDNVESNPSIETTQKIIYEFKNSIFSHIVGLGGGSSLDVAKFVAADLKKSKILIPTTFGSGSEVTRIAVLKVNGMKQSFHNDDFIADVAIIDSNFLTNTPATVKKNSAIDACAQCTEAYDSKAGNQYTKFLCKKAFEYLEDGILNNNNEKLVMGSLLTGLGFGNSSTTLGHALSYVFSNEGIAHGHALAFTTTVAHKFNKSIFYDRFCKIVETLKFPNIRLQQNLHDAVELILQDRNHLDNNPRDVTRQDIVYLLRTINNNQTINFSLN